jgi:hypothetical protein
MSMTLSQYQGKSVQEIFIFTANTVWTPPVSGRALFIAVGPGGGGAGNLIPASAAANLFVAAAGGGGGGACIKEITLNTAATYTINVGTGGIGGSNAAGIFALAANGSGNTTVVSNDGVMNLQAGFGQAGKWSGNTKAAVSAAGGPATGGAGGLSANGDYNFVGGTAADANGDTNIQFVNPVFLNAFGPPTNGVLYVTAGAGAAYFSNGANSTSNSYSGASSVYSPVANDNTITNFSVFWDSSGNQLGSANSPNPITYFTFSTPGALGYGTECGPGGYSAQLSYDAAQNFSKDFANATSWSAGTGGPFAGGGAAWAKMTPANYTRIRVSGGNGGFGGGGGAAMIYTTTVNSGVTATTAVGGRGGDGIVIVKVVRG